MIRTYHSYAKWRSLLTVKPMILLCFTLFSHGSNGQGISESKYSIEQDSDKKIPDERVTLQKALEQLSQRFNVQFGYKTDVVRNLYLDDFSWKEEKSVERALSQLLKPFNLKFKKINNTNYVIKEFKERNDEPQPRHSGQQDIPLSVRSGNENQFDFVKADYKNVFPVSGRVLSDRGEAIPGVSVTVKGSNIGAVTDSSGTFVINVENEKSILIFSNVGYTTSELTVGNEKFFSIVLMPSAATSMNEVVVVGYNTQRRGDLTGSVASVKSKDLANLPATSLSNALQGRVPGAFISQTDGNPNSNASVIIRGPLSINGGEPLYIVDGVPFQGTGFNFNIQDIESVDILKDASAAAIYGYRAAGGVILIQTKKGKSGKIKVGFNSTIGVREVIGLPATLRRDEYISAKSAFGFNVEDLYGSPSGWNSLPDTDWFDEMYQKGVEQNYSLFLNGGSEKSNFYISGNYGKIQGTRIGNFIERYTFRINSEHKIGNRIKIGQTFYGGITTEDPNAATNQGDLSFRNTPVMNVYDPSNPIGGWGKAPKGFQGGNDVQSAIGNYTRNEGNEILLTVNADVEIIKGLVFRTVLGTGITGANNYYFNYRADVGTAVTEPTFGKYLSRTQSFIATYTLAYQKKMGLHELKALAGYEARRANFTDLSGNNRNPLVPEPQDFNLVQSVSSAVVNGRIANVFDRVLSQFGRVEYNYNDKYLLTGTIRRDGLASKFGPNNRYGIFPGVSAGWKISEENFMRNVPAVSYLKLRAGYGLLGNSVGADFAYSAAYGTGYSNDFGGGRLNSVNIINRLPNPDIRWEAVASTNIGVDAGFFDDKLVINLDLYSRQTKDMIYNVGIAPSAGLGGSVPANIGQMSNKGFEFNIEYRGKAGKEFTYSLGFNGAYNKNRLIALDPSLGRLFLTNGSLSEAHGNTATSRSEPGRELGNFYGFDVSGIYQSDIAPGESRPTINGGYIPVAGDLIYRDLNNDGQINADDRTYIGSPWPKLTYGLNLKLAWRNFDFNVFFNGVAGVDIYNGYHTYEHLFFSDYTTTSKIFQTSGFNGKGITDIPRVGTIDNFDRNLNWTSVNSYHVQQASYIRLRNIQLGYNLPLVLSRKVRISNLRLYIMADNLFTITNYNGINPDLGTGSFLNRGIDNANFRYPVSRIFSFGVNVDF